ncbi:MAG TPA: glycoside hydrolase family 43 protein [Longimicrobiaceae bacterium]|nr:glycoside hydrolase family 43 protein [Longimicrobiaceae bacterium]
METRSGGSGRTTAPGRASHRRRAAAAGALVLATIAVGCAGGGGTGAAPTAGATFTNPVVHEEAGDPWVIRYGDAYYFTATLDPEGGLWVWKSPTLTGLDSARKVKVWTAPGSGPASAQIWAPELHRLDGRWYLYFTASDGVDDHHRIYVLEAKTDDPLGPYEPPVRVDPAFDHYAIDASVLRMPGGRLYLMYAAGGLFIAPLSSPTHVAAPGVKIADRTYHPWEHGWRREGGEWVQDAGYWIEAPEALIHDGRVFVIYSAGHTATPHYYLGMLSLRGDDPMDPAAWSKSPEPVFAPYESAAGDVYTTGHNSFTTSPDGTEDWLVYHARDVKWPSPDVHGRRTVRVQPFTWKADGTPDFGHPVPSGVELPVPSGEVGR